MRHHHGDQHTTDALLRMIIDNQHFMFKEFQMSASAFQAQLDALTAAQGALGDAISAEIAELATIVSGSKGPVSPAQTAQIQSVIDNLNTAVTALKASTAAAIGSPPVNVEPTALASAITAAVNLGATDAQLQVIRNLGDGVSPTSTTAMLRDAVNAALVAASDGTAAATADQLAALIALVAPLK